MKFDNLMGERYEGAVLFNKRKASGFKSGVKLESEIRRAATVKFHFNS